MRILLFLFCLFSSLALAAPFTPETMPNQRLLNGSHVSDPDGIIGAETSARIDQLLVGLEKGGGAQVAVVAVNSIGQSSVFDFAQQLFVSWGIGRKGKDDGLLILLVKDQRTVRLHTGYGLEGVLPDAVCKRIQREFMVPAFREGRYGDGLLAGVGEVARLLGYRAADAVPLAEAQTAEEQPARRELTEDDYWLVFMVMFGGVWVVLVLIVFAIKSIFGYFSHKRVREGDTPVSVRYSRLAWFAIFLGLPGLIVVAINAVRPTSPVLTCLLALYLYFMLVAVEQIWRERRLLGQLWQDKEYKQLDLFLDQGRGFWGKIAFLFPLPFLFYWIYHGTRKNAYRTAPRACEKCAQAMRRLSESEDDAFLSAGQQKEEKLHSVDYDIWLCDACKTTELWAYPGKNSEYSECPKCRNQTVALEKKTVLKAATLERAGQGELIHGCRFCDYKKREKYSIDRLASASSSSDSSSSSFSSSGSSSSSSGSSWGGGDSGGGGASSSW